MYVLYGRLIDAEGTQNGDDGGNFRRRQSGVYGRDEENEAENGTDE
ncbi:MAG: hypothetical protein ACREJM_09695 [Candidatus Saccharimonadales bacterium]